MTKFLEAESLEDFVNQGRETKKDMAEKFKMKSKWKIAGKYYFRK